MSVHGKLRGYPHPDDVGRAVQYARGETRAVLRNLRSEDIAQPRLKPWMLS